MAADSDGSGLLELPLVVVVSPLCALKNELVDVLVDAVAVADSCGDDGGGGGASKKGPIHRAEMKRTMEPKARSLIH